MNNKNVRYEKHYLIEKNPMTIIAGVRYDKGIVIGSDSQLTYPDTLIKSTGHKKMFEIKANSHLSFTLAGAGNPFYINIFRDILKNYCFQQDVKTLDKFSFVCEDVATYIIKRYVIDKSVKLGLVQRENVANINLSQWQDEIDSILDYSLLIGVVANNNDMLDKGLFTVIPRGEVISNENYSAIGHGWIFAEYIFSRLWDKDLKYIGAIDTILYILEEVKKMDITCGGDTEISMILDNGEFTPQDDKFRETLKLQSDVLQKLDSALVRVWRDMLKDPTKAKSTKNSKKNDKQEEIQKNN